MPLFVPLDKARRGEKSRGFTLLETLGALTVSALMLMGLAGLWNQAARDMTAKACGSHLAAVTRAGQEYGRRHYSSLLEAASATSGTELGIADLIAANLLPEGFAETSPWNQAYTAAFRRTDTDAGSGQLILAVVTSGGRGTDYDTDNAAFFHVEAPSAARRAGASAGYTAGPANPGGYAEGTLVSAFGGYAVSLSAYGLAEPGPGHLGSLSVCGEGNVTADVLYRVAVDGYPELNQMETELDMTGHSILNTGSMQFVSYASSDTDRPVEAGGSCSEDDLGRLFLDEDNGLLLCRLVDGSATPELVLIADSGNADSLQEATLAVDGDLINKPVCASGTGMEPRIFLAPAVASSGPQSPAMAAFRAWATSEDDETWQVHLKVKNVSHTDDDWYSATEEGETLAPYYGSAMVFTLCARVQD